MTNIRIAELWQYPIKGCAGEMTPRVDVTRSFGLDRRWMVVDERGMFVAQRAEGSLGVAHRLLCKIKPKIHDDYVLVQAPQMPQLLVPLKTHTAALSDVQVWSWKGKALEVSRACSDWFTEYLNRGSAEKQQYRLMQMCPGLERLVPGTTSAVGFADAYPVLVISQASLDRLNSQLKGEPVGADRFRPNIVLSGDIEAHGEDGIDMMMSQSGVILQGRKLCDRCQVVATHQQTGEVDNRPLRALGKYRKFPDSNGKSKVWFGKNFTHHRPGMIAVGDRMTVI